jgi:hypothetical protein
LEKVKKNEPPPGPPSGAAGLIAYQMYNPEPEFFYLDFSEAFFSNSLPDLCARLVVIMTLYHRLFVNRLFMRGILRESVAHRSDSVGFFKTLCYQLLNAAFNGESESREFTRTFVGNPTPV